MKVTVAVYTACVILLGVGACAIIKPAVMSVPESLKQSSTEYSVTNLGGRARGSYRIGEHSGSFRRSESRLEIFDVLDFRSGSADYTLAGPMVEGQIEADCRMRERILNLGNFQFTPKAMAYRCEFTINGRSFPARFEIQEAKEGLSGALMKKERRGEIALDRIILQIQSVHDLQGSSLQLATPIGYMFYLNQTPIGAIELNGTPKMYVPKTDDKAVQRAVIAAGLALAIFWDPAESDLYKIN